MQAIREIKTIINRTVTVSLPPDFTADEVEVIIIPHVREESGTVKSGTIDISRSKGIYRDMDFDASAEALRLREEWERPV